MVASFRSIAVTTSADNVAANLPSGITTGDYLGAIAICDFTGITIPTPPTGWTLRSGPTSISGDGQTIWYYDRIANGSESSQRTWNFSGGGDHVIVIFAASGIDNTNPRTFLTATTPNTSANSSPASIGLTGGTAVDGNLLVWIALLDTNDGDSSWSFTAPSSPAFTERSDTSFNWTSLSVATRDGSLVSAGATGTITGTATSSGDSTAFSGYVIALAPASSGTTVSTGRADETDTALALSVVKTAATGRANETDTSVARALLGYGVSTEIDTAIAAAVSKSVSVGRADETDAALALALVKTIGVARSDETDVALSTGFASQLTAGRSDETDTSFSLALTKTIATGRADETDTAVTVGIVPNIAAGRADETDTAFAAGLTKTVAAGRADETDTAFGRQLVGYGIATETDSSLALSFASAMATGRADEVDAALSNGLTKTLSGPGLSIEVDTALSPGFAAFFGVGRADETDEAFGGSLSKSAPAGLAGETDVALALALNREFATVGRANETDVALTPGAFSKQFLATEVSVELDTALGPGWIVAGGGGADVYQRNRIRGLRVP